MPKYNIELRWKCPACGQVVLGRHKKCTGCGQFRTEHEPDIWPDDTSESNAVKDVRLNQRANAGADWKCAYCGSSQGQLDHKCIECGADQRQGREVDMDRKVVETDVVTGKVTTRTLHKARKPESKVTMEQMLQEDIAKERATAQAVIKEAVEADPFRSPPTPRTEKPKPSHIDYDPFATATPRKTSRRTSSNPWDNSFSSEIAGLRPSIHPAWFIGAGVAALLTLILVLIFHKHPVDTTVTAVAWTRTYHVDRYTIYAHEGWDPPSDAFEVQDLGRRIHHYDHVRVGSHTEHYTERVACGQDCRPNCRTTSRTCTSGNNGFASCSGGDTVCTQDCSTRYCNESRTRTVDDYEDQPRYRDWYSWRVWEWGHNRDVKVAGNKTTDVAWPSDDMVHLKRDIGPKEDERIGGQEETFDVTFSGDGDSWHYKPDSVVKFQTLPLGHKHRIMVNAVGQVELQP